MTKTGPKAQMTPKGLSVSCILHKGLGTPFSIEIEPKHPHSGDGFMALH
jgi:hypothetical protein